MAIDTEDDKSTEGAWEDVNTPIMDVDTNQPLTMTVAGPDGKPVKEIINDPTKSFLFDRMDIKVESIPYDTDDTADKLMLEQTLQGPAGQLIMQANPGEYLKGVSLLTREYRTKNSGKVSDWLDNMAKAMGALPWQDPREVEQGTPPGGNQPAQATGAGNMSSAMGLDTNVGNK